MKYFYKLSIFLLIIYSFKANIIDYYGLSIDHDVVCIDTQGCLYPEEHLILKNCYNKIYKIWFFLDLLCCSSEIPHEYDAVNSIILTDLIELKTMIKKIRESNFFNHHEYEYDMIKNSFNHIVNHDMASFYISIKTIIDDCLNYFP